MELATVQSTTATKHGVILEKTERAFEELGVLNPAIYQDGNSVHMFYRAAKKGNFSTIGYCRFEGPTTLVERLAEPIFSPEYIYEIHGVEDPRITKIDDTFYMTYVTYDGLNASGALATSKDLKKFKKKGIITPKFILHDFTNLIRKHLQNSSIAKILAFNVERNYPLAQMTIEHSLVWDKNVVLFPKKINGKFVALHRLFPSIQIFTFEKKSDLTVDFWKEYLENLPNYLVMEPRYKHETSHIGPGAPPIETKDGWLMIYHAAEKRDKGLVYHACAVLLDLENPQKVIGRLTKPIITPEEYYERNGYVNYVVFPTGTAIFDDLLYIYYGAADDKIAVASLNLNDLLTELKQNSHENDI
ncbi:pesticidal protein Cry7Aa [Flavobacterium sp. MR2016-29]|uniref:glycoside hydrolase family 130 protein n=1 Tax=Flavobacterium sp. MR2016-29 TaxID=2783795 RepID=UPI00188BD892|nr:pesticidal protein Cry7Aa [Flavobacterium sp. MR2016-29]MBF4494476.1 pesticidal protein Cry7Aa [Flavobacterium sp. MR2016-29]